jgi:competence protein ComEC
MRLVFGTLLLACALSAAPANDMKIFFIDVEGGQSTLFVSPSGESFLIDAGFALDRDSDRIVAAAKAAGVSRIDHLLITHYHGDHAGGVKLLAGKIPIRHFYDRGPSEQVEEPEVYENYKAVADKGIRTRIKPGDAIPVPGLSVRVLAVAGETLKESLPGAGQENPECASFAEKKIAINENVRSAGVLVSYGKFEMLDLGDIPWQWEKDLVCPVNKIGTVDVFLLPHHGNNDASIPQLVHAIRPRVAVNDNGATKGGGPESFRRVADTPGLEGFWSLHYALKDGKDNVPEPFIANPDEKCEGKWIEIAARADGSFTVTNSRNGNQRTYPAKN